MPFHLRDPATCDAVRQLAKLRNVSLNKAIREAVEKALAREAAARKAGSSEKMRLGSDE